MKNNKEIHKGEVYIINNNRINGHRSLIIDMDKTNVDAIIFTHSSFTRRKKNHKLEENPDKNDFDINGRIRDSYILKLPQKANKKDIGKQYPGFRVRNSIDKSYIRHISKKK